MIQTQLVMAQLQQHWPNLSIPIEQIRTTGDRVTDKPLSQIGGDGVFITEIENALREGRIDLAVHSLKDLPTSQPQGLLIVVIGPREDVRDVLISNIALPIPSISQEHFQPLDSQAGHFAPLRIGTSSLRRAAQIRAILPVAEILSIRGNVDTRLRKLEASEYDAIILASAGLHRMNLQERLAGRLTYLPLEHMMPAPGQGALALEIRDEPAMQSLLAPLRDVITEATTSAERMYMRHLGAGCFLPVAAYGEIAHEQLILQGLVTSLNGKQQVRVCRSIPWTADSTLEQAEQLGMLLADDALVQGAGDIIENINVLREPEQQHV
jgi:hydroxymethylbilane synthase